MSHFRPWESRTTDNSQANQETNDADFVQMHQQEDRDLSMKTNQQGNRADPMHRMQIDQHGYSNQALLDTYIGNRHQQIITRLMHLEGRFAKELYLHYITSLTLLHNSVSCATCQQSSVTLQTIPQSSKQQYDDLFFIVCRQCEILEEHMRRRIDNGSTVAPGTAAGKYSTSDGVLDLSTARDYDQSSEKSNVLLSQSSPNSNNNRLLTENALRVLNCWYDSNQHHPYPTFKDALQIAKKCEI